MPTHSRRTSTAVTSVIIVNADKVAIGGDKLNSKKAYRHSGYPGGLSSRTIGENADGQAPLDRGREGHRRHKAAQQAESCRSSAS